MKVLCNRFKNHLALLAFLWFGALSYGQNLELSMKGSISQPTGYQSENTTTALGFNLDLDYGFKSGWVIGAEVGYGDFEYKMATTRIEHLEVISLQLQTGYDFRLTDRSRLQLRLGPCFYLTESSVPYYYEGFAEFGHDLGLGASIEYSYDLNEDLRVSGEVGYDQASELSYLSFGMGLRYRLWTKEQNKKAYLITPAF